MFNGKTNQMLSQYKIYQLLQHDYNWNGQIDRKSKQIKESANVWNF